MKVLAYWLAVLAALLVSIPHMHLPFSALYNPGAAVIVGLPLVGLLLCRLGFTGLTPFAGRMLRLQLTDDDQLLIAQLNSGAFLLAGAGVIVGMIHVLRNLANPDAIGPGVALAFVALVYGALVPVLLLPLSSKEMVSKLSKQAAIFAFLVCPACVGITLSALHVVKVF